MGFASRTPFIRTLNTLQAGFITPLCKNLCCSHFPSCKVHPETLPISLYKHIHYFPPLFSFSSFSSEVWKSIYKTRGVLSTVFTLDCQGQSVSNRTLNDFLLLPVYTSVKESYQGCYNHHLENHSAAHPSKDFLKGMGWIIPAHPIQSWLTSLREGQEFSTGIWEMPFSKFSAPENLQLLSGLEKSHSHFLNAGT